jgi:hypothetical protein
VGNVGLEGHRKFRARPNYQQIKKLQKSIPSQNSKSQIYSNLNGFKNFYESTKAFYLKQKNSRNFSHKEEPT